MTKNASDLNFRDRHIQWLKRGTGVTGQNKKFSNKLLKEDRSVCLYGSDSRKPFVDPALN